MVPIAHWLVMHWVHPHLQSGSFCSQSNRRDEAVSSVGVSLKLSLLLTVYLLFLCPGDCPCNQTICPLMHEHLFAPEIKSCRFKDAAYGGHLWHNHSFCTFCSMDWVGDNCHHGHSATVSTLVFILILEVVWLSTLLSKEALLLILIIGFAVQIPHCILLHRQSSLSVKRLFLIGIVTTWVDPLLPPLFNHEITLVIEHPIFLTELVTIHHNMTSSSLSECFPLRYYLRFGKSQKSGGPNVENRWVLKNLNIQTVYC